MELASVSVSIGSLSEGLFAYFTYVHFNKKLSVTSQNYSLYFWRILNSEWERSLIGLIKFNSFSIWIGRCSLKRDRSLQRWKVKVIWIEEIMLNVRIMNHACELPAGLHLVEIWNGKIMLNVRITNHEFERVSKERSWLGKRRAWPRNLGNYFVIQHKSGH